jgi:nucleotide-binding universal stress UspA family protein
MTDSNHKGPILFAYDGSEQAQEAIREAGRQLRKGRRAIVLSVWETFGSLPFVGAPGIPPPGLDDSFEKEALKVAREGAKLAREAGFQADASAEQGDPIWAGIVASANEHDASIIVMGSHGRTGAPLVLLGSIAEATARHTDRPVLIAHRPI